MGHVVVVGSPYHIGAVPVKSILKYGGQSFDGIFPVQVFVNHFHIAKP